MDRIFDRAVCFAVQAHSGMTRKGSKTPYIVHPLEAACLAMCADQCVRCVLFFLRYRTGRWKEAIRD